MATGKVIRFDAHKGFGFIAPDGGGEDVFVHTTSVLGDPTLLRPGMTVEFEPTVGDQGVKALTVRVVREASRGVSVPHDDAELCDVISAAELTREVTDILLAVAPSLTGTQILEIRNRLAAYARARRWLEDD